MRYSMLRLSVGSSLFSSPLQKPLGNPDPSLKLYTPASARWYGLQVAFRFLRQVTFHFSGSRLDKTARLLVCSSNDPTDGMIQLARRMADIVSRAIWEHLHAVRPSFLVIQVIYKKHNLGIVNLPRHKAMVLSRVYLQALQKFQIPWTGLNVSWDRGADAHVVWCWQSRVHDPGPVDRPEVNVAKVHKLHWIMSKIADCQTDVEQT